MLQNISFTPILQHLFCQYTTFFHLCHQRLLFWYIISVILFTGKQHIFPIYHSHISGICYISSHIVFPPVLFYSVILPGLGYDKRDFKHFVSKKRYDTLRHNVFSHTLTCSCCSGSKTLLSLLRRYLTMIRQPAQKHPWRTISFSLKMAFRAFQHRKVSTIRPLWACGASVS